MLTCPKCKSEFIFYSKKYCCFLCEECGNKIKEHSRMRFFFSYGHDKNTPVVEEIRKTLEQRGHDVWMDRTKIVLNDDWRQEITKGIINSDEVVSFLSNHSIRDPGVCRDEVQIAISLKNERVIRILLESSKDIKLTTAISSRQYLNMKDWETYYSQGGDVWREWFDKKMSELIKCIENPDNQQFDGEITELIKELKPTDFTTRSKLLLEKQFRGRKWLLEKYEKWKKNKNSKMCVFYGNPGVGKSAFSSRLVDYDVDVIASVFFEFSRKDLSVFDNITNILSFQMACKLPDYRDYLLHYIKSNGNVRNINGSLRFELLITRPLRDCIDGNRDTVVIVIDALDEGYDLNRTIVLDLISQLQLLPNWIKVFFTSRRNNAIETMLDNAEEIFIEKYQNENESDIKKYLSGFYGTAPDIDKLVKKCEGSFLYANMISDKVESENFVNVLLEKKGGLDSFYYVDFCRKFSTTDLTRYKKFLPVLELICANNSIPEIVICETLNYSKYQLEEFKNVFCDYIICSEKSIKQSVYKTNYIELMFFHKSFIEWLIEPNISAEFFVDYKKGARILADYILRNRYNNNSFIWETMHSSLSALLIKAEMYKEYIDFLIEGHGHVFWNQVINIPSSVDIKLLYNLIVSDCQKAQQEASQLTSRYEKLTWNTWWTLIGSFGALANCLSDSRFSGALVEAFKGTRVSPLYFCTPISDLEDVVCDTKPEIAAALSDCVDQADIYGYTVPYEIRKEVDMYKLCVCYIEDIVWKARVEELRSYYKKYHYEKEMCALEDEDLNFSDVSLKNELVDLRDFYNSICLRDYIINNYNSLSLIDMISHIKKLIKFGADIQQVQNMFNEYIQKEKDRGGSEKSLAILEERVNEIINSFQKEE